METIWTKYQALTLELLRWLAAHGISPLVPLIAVAMTAGACLAVLWVEWRRK